MGLEIFDSLKAVAFWSALNLGFMMYLAINVYKKRAKARVAVGSGSDGGELERAIRAHGNNIEYVPGMLFGMLMLAFMGEGATALHIAGATLLVARVLHAVGIQQTHVPVPMPRVLGNVFCWALFAIIIVRLLFLSF